MFASMKRTSLLHQIVHCSSEKFSMIATCSQCYETFFIIIHDEAK
jgi:hypothetical protein